MMTLKEAFPEVGSPKKEIILPPINDDVLETARAARELISDPNHWTQGSDYRKKKVSITEGVWIKKTKTVEVDAYCLRGAINEVASRLYPNNPFHYRAVTMEALHKQLDGSEITLFNDNHRHEDVIRALDALIASRERKAA